MTPLPKRAPEEKPKPKRYLCSDLLRVRGVGNWNGWANLEEIWDEGAILDTEIAAEPGQKLLLRKDGGKIWGVVESCDQHEFGFRVELRFLFEYWSPELFRPEHLLDPDQILRPESTTTPEHPAGN